MVCKKCGYQNTQGAIYCSGCGRKLDSESPQNLKFKRHKVIAALLAVLFFLLAIVLFLMKDGSEKPTEWQPKDTFGQGTSHNQPNSQMSGNGTNKKPQSTSEVPRDNPPDYLYYYALANENFYDGTYCYAYLYELPDYDNMMPRCGTYDSKLAGINVWFENNLPEDASKDGSAYYVEYVDAITDDGNGAITIVTHTVESGNIKRYVIDADGNLVMYAENGNAYNGRFYELKWYELFRLKIADMATWYDVSFEIPLSHFKEMASQVWGLEYYVGDYVMLELLVHNGEIVSAAQSPLTFSQDTDYSANRYDDGAEIQLGDENVASYFSDEEVTFTLDSGKTVSCTVLCLDRPVHNCTSVAINLDIIELRSGNVQGEWGFYVRDLDGVWSLADTFELCGNSSRAVITFKEPINFDAWACPCHVLGDSWDFNFAVWLDDAKVIHYEG